MGILWDTVDDTMYTSSFSSERALWWRKVSSSSMGAIAAQAFFGHILSYYPNEAHNGGGWNCAKCPFWVHGTHKSYN